ncbi:unnamed protein product [Brassica rapa subsp. narinosa]
MESLSELDLTDCSLLKCFPDISTNIQVLKLSGTAIEEVPLSIRNTRGFSMGKQQLLSSCLVIFNEWRQLSLLPQLPEFLSLFYARVCKSMSRMLLLSFRDTY